MTDKNPHASEADDLGPVIYGERMHITPAVIYTSLGLAFMVIGLLVSFLKDPNPRAPRYGMLIMGLVVATGGALCLAIGLVRLIPNLGAGWYLHERGVRLVKRHKESVLRH